MLHCQTGAKRTGSSKRSCLLEPCQGSALCALQPVILADDDDRTLCRVQPLGDGKGTGLGNGDASRRRPGSLDMQEDAASRREVRLRISSRPCAISRLVELDYPGVFVQCLKVPKVFSMTRSPFRGRGPGSLIRVIGRRIKRILRPPIVRVELVPEHSFAVWIGSRTETPLDSEPARRRRPVSLVPIQLDAVSANTTRRAVDELPRRGCRITPPGLHRDVGTGPSRILDHDRLGGGGIRNKPRGRRDPGVGRCVGR